MLLEPFKLTNDADGFQLLSSHLDSLPDDSFIIGLESTAYYGDNLVRYLVNDGHKFCVINPIQTSTLRKNNIGKTKTNNIIAKALMLQKSLRFVTVEDINLMDLKALGRFRQKSLKQRTRLKIQIKAYVVETFPELQYFFKFGLHQKAVYALLKEAPSAKDVASLNLTYLTHLLEVAAHGNFKKETASQLRALARKSAGSLTVLYLSRLSISLNRLNSLTARSTTLK